MVSDHDEELEERIAILTIDGGMAPGQAIEQARREIAERRRRNAERTDA